MSDFTDILLPITCPVCQHTWEMETPAIPWRALPISGEVLCASCDTTLRVLFQEKDGQLHRSIKAIPSTMIGEEYMNEQEETNLQESSTERNTHFRNWATHLYEDLRGDLYVLFLAWTAHERDQEREETAALAVKNTLAQHGYDLVEHVLSNGEFQWYELEELSVKDIPDLPGRPAKPGETG